MSQHSLAHAIASFSWGVDSLDEASRLGVEKNVLGLWAPRPAGCAEAGYVVVRGQVAGSAIGLRRAIGLAVDGHGGRHGGGDG